MDVHGARAGRKVEEEEEGVVALEPQVHGDDRGFLVETFSQAGWTELGIDCEFVQHNHSRSTKDTLRGLHFQLIPGQAKLVRCPRGAIFDVAVDLRRGSPGFGRHVAVVLDDEALQQLWVPPGFAHGFLVLSEVADVSYKVDAFHAPASEGGIRWDDPTLGIDWNGAGLELEGGPLVSPRDAALPSLVEAEFDFVYQAGRRS